MADSLDDFFAKKDKKRAKDKSKGAALSAEALVRELEEGSRQLDYPVRKENKTSTAIELLGLDADDADWRDFEDVEKRDYTGLKVKEMSLQDQADEEQRRLSEQSDPIPESTPWKIKDDQQTISSATTETNSDAKQKNNSNKVSDKTSDTTTTSAVSSSNSSSSTTDKKDDSTAGDKSPSDQDDSSEKKGDKPSAKYVPPAARLMTSEVKVLEPSKLGKSKPSGGRQEPIPNIQDETAFPSLG